MKSKYIIIPIFFMFFSMPTIHSMDFFYGLRYQLGLVKIDEAKIAKSFIRECPLMTLKNLRFRYSSCSSSVKEEIVKYVNTSGNEQLSNIFYFATEMLPELQKKIISKAFNNNEAAAHKFLHLPLIKAYSLLFWTEEVAEGRKDIASSWNMNSKECIFLLSDQIKRGEKIVQKNKILRLGRMSYVLGKKDIRTLCTIRNNSKTGKDLFLGENFCFAYYKKYYWRDFRRLIVPITTISLCWYVPLTVIGLSRLIGLYSCKKIIKDFSLAEKIDDLTKLIHQSGNLSLLDAVKDPEDNLTYNLFNLLKKNLPFLCVSPTIAYLGSFHLSYKDPRFLKNFLFIGSTYGILVAFALYFLSWLPIEKFSGRLVGLPDGFIGLYITIPIATSITTAAFSVGTNLWEQTTFIDWDTIEQEVKSADLVIPQKSRVIWK